MAQFMVIGRDGPEGAKRRDLHRERHVAYVGGLDGEGKVVLAGPIRSDDGERSVGVLIVLEAADLDEARRMVERDPYVKGEVFESLTVSPFTQVFPVPS